MAVEHSIASDGRSYNGKMTSIVILSCMVAATGGIIFGYDIGISGLFTKFISVSFIISYYYLKMENHIRLQDHGLLFS